MANDKIEQIKKPTRTKYVQVRLTDDEKAKLEKLARESHLSLSGYARTRLLSN